MLYIACTFLDQSYCRRIVDQASFVRRLDNAIPINLYPVDSVVRFVTTYLLESDLFTG